jgi:segregation and condensation protein A
MYEVQVDTFQGPLDLLLHLIKKNQVNIYDIPIALITEQYLEYIQIMKALDLDVAGEFLVMSATLMYIKSRMLLPSPPDDDEEEEDPRAELVERLLEYKRYKEAAGTLAGLDLLGSHVFARPEVTSVPQDGEIDADIFNLIDALRKVLEREQITSFHEVNMERVTLMDKIRELWELLQGSSEAVPFVSLFRAGSGREEMIVTFLALLELVKSGMLRAYQRDVFGPLWVMRL